MITIVAATDKNNALGADGKIPWRIKSDLVRLRNVTLGHTVILGRKSYDSMVQYYNRSGRPMPGACYIVITRNERYTPGRPNAKVAHSVGQALQIASQLNDPEIFIIGGGSIFEQSINLADRVYLTQVAVTASGNIDAWFPNLNPAQWRQVSRERYQKNDHDEFDTDFVIYEKA